MPLNMEQMQRLGLDKILEKDYENQAAYQKAMAARLRELTFAYLRGDLQGDVADGPQVKELRENLRATGEFEGFIKEQSAQGAWATSLELTILAELLEANLVVRINSQDRLVCLTESPNVDNPTLCVCCDHNTHWSFEHEGIKKSTLGDGNCGYNAVALWLEATAEVKPSYTRTPAASTRHYVPPKAAQDCVQASQEAEQQFKSVMSKLEAESPENFKAIQRQIEEDKELAMRLALADLPDEDGEVRGTLSVADYAKVRERQQIIYLKTVNSEFSTDPNISYEGFKYP